MQMDDEWWKQNAPGHFNLEKFKHEPIQWEHELEMIFGRDVVDRELLLNPTKVGKKPESFQSVTHRLTIATRVITLGWMKQTPGKGLPIVALHLGVMSHQRKTKREE